MGISAPSHQFAPLAACPQNTSLRGGSTKADSIEIRPLSEHQNWNLENAHITTATLIKFAQKILY
jgi:hypothetical protein